MRDDLREDFESGVKRLRIDLFGRGRMRRSGKTGEGKSGDAGEE